MIKNHNVTHNATLQFESHMESEQCFAFTKTKQNKNKKKQKTRQKNTTKQKR